MKFNAVVGNPPYNLEGTTTKKEPIYHLFYDIAFHLSDIVTLITPARFLSKAGLTPKDWTNRILSDKHFKVVDHFKDSIDIFPSVDIKGGVVITLRDSNKNFGPIGFFIAHKELRMILKKVQTHKDFDYGTFSNIVFPRGLYKFSNFLSEKFPYVKDVLGKGTGSFITNSFVKLPELFLPKKPDDGDDYIRILGRLDNKRVFRWIKRSYTREVDSLDFYNVVIPKANGNGTLGEPLSKPLIAPPTMGHTDSFISIGKFNCEEEANNCLKYICSKFARIMLGIRKVTQDITSSSYSNVPLQDFTSSSDIDWRGSIADIDIQLYKKYELTEDEISFIEKMVKPM